MIQFVSSSLVCTLDVYVDVRLKRTILFHHQHYPCLLVTYVRSLESKRKEGGWAAGMRQKYSSTWDTQIRKFNIQRFLKQVINLRSEFSITRHSLPFVFITIQIIFRFQGLGGLSLIFKLSEKGIGSRECTKYAYGQMLLSFDASFVLGLKGGMCGTNLV